ncbi:molybdenum ABC transporter ATP-binding protein [Pelagicoccus albus]|uniref:Molybdenum ABC transporter ATP-binding protein n=1 Tax=Pelagicoccus albus TaxID=415222 RepID=A0A7X1B6W9_9BACT|nr:molybdenum ABC transporter ATP-binding protein [Pelagicoccus albus]MBC2606794.1 molybdenum ABC transporter ATP-binding protein [Pelagicoccus albus]
MKIDFDIQLQKGSFQLEAKGSIPSGSVTALIGPSGSGKSTLLRCLAGLEPGAKGQITIGEEPWLSSETELPTHLRRIGYVFQHAALFEHLSVSQNLQYARKRAQGEAQHSLPEIAAAIQITPLLERQVDTLSGGERQRVAIARAIASNPKLMLLDEPLSAVDENSRYQLSLELERLFQQFQIPTVFVTHNYAEAARLTNFAIRMRSGKVIASGPTAEVLDPTHGEPSATQAPFSTVDLHGRTDLAEEGLCQLESAIGQLLVPLDSIPNQLPRRIIIRSRDVGLSISKFEGSSFLNQIPAQVEEIREFSNSQALVRLGCGSGTLVALLTLRSVESLKLKDGLAVYALIKSVTLEQS